MANRLRWVASAVIGVVTLLSPQRAETGWHERLSRDVDHGELRAGLPTVASFPIYHHGSPPVKLDDTITYPGSNWFEQQEALSSFQNSLEPPQSGPPGGSLISLAKLLQSSSSQLRSALLRQFCHSVARLRTRFVGLNSSMQKTENILNNKRNSGSDETESQAATERHISALASKLTGVLGAAEGSGDSGKALTKFLLLPFVRLVHDAEGLMFNIAMEGKVGLMITALNQLAPPIVRGLSYLEAPQSQGAAGVLEPARENCLKRAKELDKALLAAQFDPNGVLRAYPRDFNKYELQREQQLISLEAGPSQQQYIPPVFETGGMPASTEKGKLGRRVKIISIVLACLLFFTVFIATAQPPHPMPIGRSYSRQNAGPHVSDGEEQAQHNRYGPTASHEHINFCGPSPPNAFEVGKRPVSYVCSLAGAYLLGTISSGRLS
ncbi:hypothetical protein, conserved [Eimeria maxima]|uniref:Uncharacterized protein n=1 Tax=Eimeria maxima TaxID=5804 RepID=U6LZK1_EIMMA|nr:hypothetical protein, conserved [Eimeria maxima]CDJ56283.1 hypothetical protein, conserved [Eimeria maxima]